MMALRRLSSSCLKKPIFFLSNGRSMSSLSTSAMAVSDRSSLEMTKLCEMVEEYAKQFQAMGFEKETMQFKE
ncbi:unnamed protein product [Eruca vesicaria subsp. sativa]|uniref:Uncharacterized protein n=1 Tax=Eruca vesicaria subsp. sativa TaxID=29727 RepID=A0ABC8K755_ERUVS|nr:unnamed protein product [Eruca vesicaria subsp. sativa]